MRVVFLCPHSRISGGVKVIFKLAQGLTKRGVETFVSLKKFNDRNLSWFDGEIPEGMLIEDKNPSYHTIPECDVIVNSGDGDPYLPLPTGVKHVLLLQNFGVHEVVTERNNILYPYDAVIGVSNWLAQLAKRCGHKKVFFVPPGIDNFFAPVPMHKPRVPVIGTLYHSIDAKNVPLFEATMQNLILKNKIAVRPLFLTAKHIPPVATLAQENVFYTVVVDPPQNLLPSVYSSCAVWMSPAYREGFGLTTLEAMACGVPVVTLRNLGLDDYLANRENCILVRDKQEASIAIQELLVNQNLTASLIKNGRELAGKFTWENTVKQFYTALQEIIKK
jgi:glycosyltransferase involved in cell wall biosynthesis